MSNKVVNLIINLKDGVSSGLQKVKSGLGSVAAAAKSLAFQATAAFAAIAAALTPIALSIKKAFDFETARLQLKTLLGTMELATERFKELRDFSASTPFQLEGILKASRLLTTFSEGALGSAASLRIIGDAAAGANMPIEDVSFWIGRAYSMLKSGKPFGEAAMRLQEMGILTAEGRNEIEKMVESGKPLEMTFSRLVEEMQRFEGATQLLAESGNGLFSTLKDNWTIAVATFGDEFQDAAKDGIGELTNEIKRLVDDGSIAKLASSLATVLDVIIKITEAWNKIRAFTPFDPVEGFLSPLGARKNVESIKNRIAPQQETVPYSDYIKRLPNYDPMSGTADLRSAMPSTEATTQPSVDSEGIKELLREQNRILDARLGGIK